MDYQPGLKAILDNSGTLVNWALAVAAGSVAAIVSTSYERPRTRFGRMIYLLFPLAWFFLGKSIYAGEQISRRFIAAQVVTPAQARKILELMQADFLHQWWMLLRELTLRPWIWYAPAPQKKRPSPTPPRETTARASRAL
jgi:hypothetical protein